MEELSQLVKMMKASVRWLSNKTFLLLVLALFLLTFLLHSVHKNPSNRMFSVDGKEGNFNENPGLWNVWNGAHDEVFNKALLNASETTLPEPRKKVLVLSSVGRSGSSFLGLLLAALGDNMYFFEPIRGLSRKFRTKENDKEELIRLFQCNIHKTVFNFGRKADKNVIHPYTRNKFNEAINMKTLMEYCNREPLIIIKTIRVRLQWIREIMTRKELENMKVIHLVRDPRGSLTSMKTLHWNVNDEKMCNNIYQDLQEKEAMMYLFPRRYAFIKYEDLCRNPYGETRRLFRFLYDLDDGEENIGNQFVANIKPRSDSEKDQTQQDPAMYQDLPNSILKFLRRNLHSGSKKPHPFYVKRNTSSMYQKWRWVIKDEQLKAIESSCRKAISALGHRLFSSLAAARNSSLALFEPL